MYCSTWRFSDRVLVWLYRSTEEQRNIRALQTDIEDLKLRIRKAKKMLRLLSGQRN